MKRKNRRDKPAAASSRSKHVPERSCLGCRSKGTPQSFARLVCDQHGVIRLDRLGTAPGRGVYICFDARCLHKALARSRLISAFRCSVVVPEFGTLYQALDMSLSKRLQSYVQLAQKAGVLVSGYASLQKAFTGANIVCLVLAEDIAVARADEYHSWCIRQNIPYMTLFSKEELGQLIGKSDRSAVGLTATYFCRQLHITVKSLERLRASMGLPEANTNFCQLSS